MWGKRTVRGLAVVVAAIALVGADLSIAGTARATDVNPEQKLVDLVNGERAKRDLPKLKLNTGLKGVARDWSDHMASCSKRKSRAECLQHNPDYASQISSRVTDDWTRLGENVGYTIKTGASKSELAHRLHKALMESEGHRRNILGDYNQVGVGVAIGSDGAMWVTQNFMHAPITDDGHDKDHGDKTGEDGVKGDGGTSTIDLSGKAIPITGDWDGDGKETPGWFDGGKVFLRNDHGEGPPDLSYTFGRSGDVPIVGDWNGDGKDTLGVLRGGHWYLRYRHASGAADKAFIYGRLNAGDYALSGDWNGDGRDTVGIVRGGEWHLRDELAGGHADRVFIYGRVKSGDVPVTGDWNRDGRDTPGIIRGSEWHLRHANKGGVADRVFIYGKGTDTPVVGDWFGKGATGPGIVRDGQWHLKHQSSGGGADLSYGF